MQRQLTAIIEREGDGYVSLCPQRDIASQGDEARENLREALELFFETALASEMRSRCASQLMSFSPLLPAAIQPRGF